MKRIMKISCVKNVQNEYKIPEIIKLNEKRK